MLIILMFFLILSSIVVLVVKRNKETFYIFGMTTSLAIMLTGILLYIAKKGGISRDIQEFLFFNNEIKTAIQYYLITLNGLGYIIAIGRYLFPTFLLCIALHYSMVPWLQRYSWVKRIVFVLPVLSLIFYYPSVYYFLNVDSLKRVVSIATIFWIISFILLSLLLLVYEAFAIKIKFIKRTFILRISLIFSLVILYLLYFGQDPAGVYQFYEWENGFYYMRSTLSVPMYYGIVIMNVLFAIIGFSSLLKYTHEIFDTSRKEIAIQRKFDAISIGASVFVHGIKNQLLANRVIFKRMNYLIENGSDIEKLKEYIHQLSKQNETMLLRIDELYRSVKTNIVHLIPVLVCDVIEASLERFYQKYPNKQIKIELEANSKILADKAHLSEAVYNLLINAQEAVNDLANEEASITLRCYNVRLYTVIEVQDNGVGISKEELNKLCEPFYSNKNSNFNWGMGLHYVNKIAKEHFGMLRYESEKGSGSTFYILLPKF